MEGVNSNQKRSANFQHGHDGAKRARTDSTAGRGGGGGKGMSVAQRMMAKMGYQKGQGLGREGSGIVNPIEVQLRPQGVGVGAIKEQPDAPQPRDAGSRKKKPTESPNSESPRHVPKRQPKTRYEVASETWSDDSSDEDTALYRRTKVEIHDQTGGYKPIKWIQGSLSESQNAANYARRDLEAYRQAAAESKERYKDSEIRDESIQNEIETQESSLLDLRDMLEALSNLQKLESFQDLVSALEELQSNYKDEVKQLSELAVSAIYPYFKLEMSQWEPLRAPSEMPMYLSKITEILGIYNFSDEEAFDDLEVISSRKVASHYESMIYSSFIPKIRTTIVSEWDVYHPNDMIDVVEPWKGVLPQLAYDIMVNQLIAQKLSDALKSWRPDAIQKRHKDHPEPHVWLFPWLLYLNEYHLDPKSSSGLLAEVKRKFRTIFSTWNPSRGVVTGLDKWYKVEQLQRELKYALDLNLLPRLASHLHEKLNLDPGEPGTKPIESILLWLPYFSPEKFSRVLLDSFFPKFLNTLYSWLTTRGRRYDEIGQWAELWQAQLPDEINTVPAVEAEWEKAWSMIDQALNIDPERVEEELAKPQAGPSRPVTNSSAKLRNSLSDVENHSKENKNSTDTTTFRDLVEEVCAEQGLLMMPLRKAHVENGLPLYRITASAAGSGGIVVYLKGDIVWAQGRDKTSWQPIDIYDEVTLHSMAEAR